MKELFEFLNQQNGNRLFWYGIIFIITVICITSMFEGIFESIFKRRKPDKNKEKEKTELNN